MSCIFIFDVDGTLTASREKIDPIFQEWFINWQNKHETYLVTGSDYSKTVEQVGEKVIAGSKLIFNCSGNEVRKNGEIIYASTWEPNTELLTSLNRELNNSKYTEKTGNHIEPRTGMVNFSILGRNANKQQRQDYKKWDQDVCERIEICLRLEREFDNLDFVIAGETGIDIYPTGQDKRQILQWIDSKGQKPIVFFGDKTLPGGNDYPLATSVDVTHRVEDWNHTWDLLRMIT